MEMLSAALTKSIWKAPAPREYWVIPTSPDASQHAGYEFAPCPLTLTFSLRERSPRTLCAPWTPEPQDIRPFLPLFPTQEGGEGWGEEEFPFGQPLSPALSPLVPHGEREKVARQIPVHGQGTA